MKDFTVRFYQHGDQWFWDIEDMGGMESQPREVRAEARDFIDDAAVKAALFLDGHNIGLRGGEMREVRTFSPQEVTA